MSQFFVSFNSADRQWVRRFVPLLRKAFDDVSVFFDEESIEKGDRWWNVILDNIASSNAMIYVLTFDFFRSKYCRAEFLEAQRLGIPIVPLVIRLHTPLPFEFVETQNITMIDWSQGQELPVDVFRVLNKTLRSRPTGSKRGPRTPHPDRSAPAFWDWPPELPNLGWHNEPIPTPTPKAAPPPPAKQQAPAQKPAPSAPKQQAPKQQAPAPEPAPSTPKPASGDLLAGRYELVQRIGRGGMAEVYRALDTTLRRNLAIKIIHPSLSKDASFTPRFKHEMKSVAMLEHPHITPIYDYGTDGATHYIAMRLLDHSLSDVLKQSGAMPPRDAVKIAAAVAGALDYAYQKGWLHRDVKPSNLLMDGAGQVMVADFGLAKIFASGDQLTGDGFIGTPAYMSPELGRGMMADGRSDIYALGVVLYEMLAGKRPFDADTPMAMVLAHINSPVPPLKNVPSRLQDVVMRALAKDRSQRYQTAGEMQRDLQTVLNAL